MVERAESGSACHRCKKQFTELELSDHLRSPIGSRRDLSLFQVNFYGFLQEFILREMDTS